MRKVLILVILFSCSPEETKLPERHYEAPKTIIVNHIVDTDTIDGEVYNFYFNGEIVQENKENIK